MCICSDETLRRLCLCGKYELLVNFLYVIIAIVIGIELGSIVVSYQIAQQRLDIKHASQLIVTLVIAVNVLVVAFVLSAMIILKLIPNEPESSSNPTILTGNSPARIEHFPLTSFTYRDGDGFLAFPNNSQQFTRNSQTNPMDAQNWRINIKENAKSNMRNSDGCNLHNSNLNDRKICNNTPSYIEMVEIPSAPEIIITEPESSESAYKSMEVQSNQLSSANQSNLLPNSSTTVETAGLPQSHFSKISVGQRAAKPTLKEFFDEKNTYPLNTKSTFKSFSKPECNKPDKWQTLEMSMNQAKMASRRVDSYPLTTSEESLGSTVSETSEQYQEMFIARSRDMDTFVVNSQPVVKPHKRYAVEKTTFTPNSETQMLSKANEQCEPYFEQLSKK